MDTFFAEHIWWLLLDIKNSLYCLKFDPSKQMIFQTADFPDDLKLADITFVHMKKRSDSSRKL